MSARRGLAVVGASLAAKPGNGGHAWTRISVVRGLERLGFDVVLVEQIAGATESQRSYFESVCADFGITGLILEEPAGVERFRDATVILNVGGNLGLEPVAAAGACKVYLDDDPGYTQLWHDQGLITERLAGHDFYFTYGANVGHDGCPLPVDGIQWRATRPPVALDQWPVVGAPPLGFSTVASWRGGYGRVANGPRLYGQKAHEFRRFASLPQLVDQTFEIALAIDQADSDDARLLSDHGWNLVDPATVASTPQSFRSYVQRSAAEFSVAQGIYVESCCGWFSDRTTRYLASGRPAVVQDCGFTATLPTGEGLLAFSTLDEAAAAISAVAADYATHARAARAIAAEYFDSDKVLGRLLDEVGL